MAQAAGSTFGVGLRQHRRCSRNHQFCAGPSKLRPYRPPGREWPEPARDDLGMTSTTARGGSAVLVGADLRPRFDEILTPDALDFVAELTIAFGPRRTELLHARDARYAAGQPGQGLGFLDETATVR